MKKEVVQIVLGYPYTFSTLVNLMKEIFLQFIAHNKIINLKGLSIIFRSMHLLQVCSLNFIDVFMNI